LLEMMIFVSSLTDKEENARVVASVLRTQFEPKRLRSPKLRLQLQKALDYRGLIASTILGTHEGVLQDRLERATEPVDDWIKAIYTLAVRLDAYEQNRVIQQDLRSVPLAIDNFKKRLDSEADPAVRATLNNTIADKQRQWEQLSHLQNTMEKAQYQLDSTLAALGTVYAQLQTIDLQGSDKGHVERLREDIGEQVSQLQDLSQAMDEVYSQAG
jgi:chromosome segregation ATPase